MRRNGGIIGPRQSPTFIDAKGIWDTHDQSIYRRTGTFPRIGSIGNVFLNGSLFPQSISEGSALTYLVQTTGIPDGETIDWQVQSVAGTVTSADFSGDLANMSGTVTVNSNSATLTGGLAIEGGTENESFRVQFRPSNSGQDWSLGNSPTCVIVDVNLTFYYGSAITDSNVIYDNSNIFFYRNTMTGSSTGTTDGFVWKEFLDHILLLFKFDNRRRVIKKFQYMYRKVRLIIGILIKFKVLVFKLYYGFKMFYTCKLFL